MTILRTLQYALLAFCATATGLYAVLMSGAAFIRNNLLQFTPDGHRWDILNDPLIQNAVLATLAIVLALEAVHSLLRYRAASRAS